MFWLFSISRVTIGLTVQVEDKGGSMDQAAPDSQETQELLRRAGEGEAGASEQLLARHRADLRAFVELRLDSRFRARFDASDVVQEALMEALRRLPDYLRRRPMSFRDWLRRTAYERLLMLRRRHAGAAGRSLDREVALPDRSSLALARRLLAPGSTPSQRLAEDELARRVQSALERLTETDRDLLLMRNCEGMSYADVACILGIDAATARKRHGRALLRLHRLLAETDPEGQP
jgi:RNA polymerase sigma-70 factor (ECF subfamily)